MEPWLLAGIITRIALYASLALAAGTALFSVALGNRFANARLRPMFWLSACAAVVAVAVSIYVQVGGLVDDGIAGGLDREVAGFVWAGPAGTASKVLILGLVLAGAGFLFNGVVSQVLKALGAVLASAFVGLFGHASAADSNLLPVLITVHFACLAFWFAALFPLRRAARGALPVQKAASLAHRFGQFAVAVVLLLLLVGGWAAWMLLGSVHAIISSSYGLTLLMKIVIVVLLLGLAALNRFRLVPGMQRGDERSAVALVRSINVEVALVLLILVVTATLTSVQTPPAFEMSH